MVEAAAPEPEVSPAASVPVAAVEAAPQVAPPELAAASSTAPVLAISYEGLLRKRGEGKTVFTGKSFKVCLSCSHALF